MYVQRERQYVAVSPTLIRYANLDSQPTFARKPAQVFDIVPLPHHCNINELSDCTALFIPNITAMYTPKNCRESYVECMTGYMTN
jgi:hypothetical protein